MELAVRGDNWGNIDSTFNWKLTLVLDRQINVFTLSEQVCMYIDRDSTFNVIQKVLNETFSWDSLKPMRTVHTHNI